MLQLKEGTGVFTPGGKQVGEVERFVLDPATQEVTHIVVKKGHLLREDKVVPMSMVQSGTEQRVVLKEEAQDFDKLPPFETRHFVEATDKEQGEKLYRAMGSEPAYYWYPSVGQQGYPAYGLGPYAWPPVETKRNIPKDSVALKEGSKVVCSDGKQTGKVERLFLEGDSDKVSHLLIRYGLIPDRKLIPAGWIRSVEEGSVHLSVPSGVVHGLRPYEA